MRLVHEREKASALYEYFNGIMSTNFKHSCCVDVHALGLPMEELKDLERLFLEDKVWASIQQMPSDKAPGLDGFTGLFYKHCWHIIKVDIMHAINAFWA